MSVLLSAVCLAGAFGGDPPEAFVETQKLLAFDGTEDDHFGYSIEISGDTLVACTAYRHNEGLSRVYIYERNETGGWRFTQQLNFYGDYVWPKGYRFNTDVAILGDTLVIGIDDLSYDANGDGCLDCGKDCDGNQYERDECNLGIVYIYERSETGKWFFAQELRAPDGWYNDDFGSDVKISGDTILVAAGNEGEHDLDGDGCYACGNDCNNDDKQDTHECVSQRVGSVYVYERDKFGAWFFTQKIFALDPTWGQFYRMKIALSDSGDTIVVGRPYDDLNGHFAGSVYVYERAESGGWLFTQKLLGDGKDARFGNGMAISGDTLVVGSQNQGISIYERAESGEWIVNQHDSSVPVINGIKISGSTMVVSSWTTGKHIFERNETGNWIFTQQVLHGGHSAISGDTLVVGVYNDDDNGIDSGSVYVFERTNERCFQGVGNGTTPLWSEPAAWLPNAVPDAASKVTFSCTAASRVELDLDCRAHSIEVIGEIDARWQGTGSLEARTLEVNGSLELEDWTQVTFVEEIAFQPAAASSQLRVEEEAALTIGGSLVAGALSIGEEGSLVIDPLGGIGDGSARPEIDARVVSEGRILLRDDMNDGHSRVAITGGLVLAETSVLSVELGASLEAGSLDLSESSLNDITLAGTLEVRLDGLDLFTLQTGDMITIIDLPSGSDAPDVGRFASLRVVEVMTDSEGVETEQPLAPESGRTVGVMYDRNGVHLVVLDTPRHARFGGPAYYADLPVMDWADATNVTLLTHGTNADADGWAVELARFMDEKTGAASTEYAVFDWSADSLSGTSADLLSGAGNTARRAYELGQSMAFWVDQCRSSEPLGSVHLQGHSSGAWFTEGFAARYSDLHPGTFIETTFFDANDTLDEKTYEPALALELGASADFAVHVVDRRVLTSCLYNALDETSHILPNALNLDVTPADLFARPPMCGTICLSIENIVCWHGWPYVWYRNIVEFLPDTSGGIEDDPSTPYFWGFHNTRARAGVAPAYNQNGIAGQGDVIWITPLDALRTTPYDQVLYEENTSCDSGCCAFNGGLFEVETACDGGFHGGSGVGSATILLDETTGDVASVRFDLSIRDPGASVLVTLGSRSELIESDGAFDTHVYLPFNPPLGPANRELHVEVSEVNGTTGVVVSNMTLLLVDPLCEGDLDKNGLVDGADLSLLLGSWGTANANYDINQDGTIDGADLAILLGAWGWCPE